MYGTDISLNLVTIGAIITVLGMIVDHGIVVAENIHHYDELGYDPLDASVSGVREVIAPVILTVLTTILAFLPMLTIGGVMGRFVESFPILVTVALIASFFQAVIVIPTLIHRRKAGAQTQHEGGRRWFEPAVEAYGRFLEGAIKARYVIIAVFLVALGATVYFSLGAIREFVLVAEESKDVVYVDLETTIGTPLEGTDRLTRRVEEAVTAEVRDAERIAVRRTIGNQPTSGVNIQSDREHWSQVAVFLVPAPERERVGRVCRQRRLRSRASGGRRSSGAPAKPERNL